jgi:hypothetical protein
MVNDDAAIADIPFNVAACKFEDLPQRHINRVGGIGRVRKSAQRGSQEQGDDDEC